MRHALRPFSLFCHAVAWVICSATMAMGASATRPADPVAAAIAQVRVGMTALDGRNSVCRLLPGRPMRLGAADTRGPFDAFYLDGDTTLVARYRKEADKDLNIADDEKITAVEVNHFEDLKGEIPADLYPYVHMVHLLPSFDMYGYNPAALIRVVNALQPLGKDKAIKVLRTYERLAGCEVLGFREKEGQDLGAIYDQASRDENRAFRYGMDELRLLPIPVLLFVGQDGKPIKDTLNWVTQTSIEEGSYKGRSPMLVADDIPFIARFIDVIGGAMPDPEHELGQIEHDAKMRPALLAPKGDPLRAAQTLLSSPQWNKLFQDPRFKDVENRNAGMGATALKLEALRMVSGFVEGGLPPKMTEPNADAIWGFCLEDPALKDLRWDAGRQEFTMPARPAPAKPLVLKVEAAEATVEKDKGVRLKVKLLLGAADKPLEVQPFSFLAYDVVPEDDAVRVRPVVMTMPPKPGSHELQKVQVTKQGESVEVELSPYGTRLYLVWKNVPEELALRLRYSYEGTVSNWVRCDAKVVGE